MKRLACCVPFCTRGRGDRKGDPLPADLNGYEWICGKHWRSIRLERRRVFYRYARLRKESGNSHYNGAYYGTWAALKKEAIDRAAGL